VQIGRSTVKEELAPLVKYLQRPTVHLALDPEFALPPGKVPGRVIGRMDAAQVNEASAMLATLASAMVVTGFFRYVVLGGEYLLLLPKTNPAVIFFPATSCRG